MTDILVLLVVGVAMALIIRGMLRGSIRSCDSSACAGDCGSCGQSCKPGSFTLSEEQKAQLAEIDRLGGRL